MPAKRKAECTPEEWQRYLEKQRLKRARQRESGHRPPSMQPEVLNQRRKEWLDRNKGTDRYRFLISEKIRRIKERDPEAYRAKQSEWRRNNAEKVSASRARYAERKAAGLVGPSKEPMTGERLYHLTMTALKGRYDEPSRMDIAGEAMLAFLEGDAPNIKDAVALGMKRHWRMFSKFATRSLDAEIAEGLRLIDLIADDAPRVGYAA